MYTEKNVQKMLTNGLNMGLLYEQELKRQSIEWKHWLSCKERAPSAVVCKEGHVASLLDHEIINHYWFPWKNCNYKWSFLLPIP